MIKVLLLIFIFSISKFCIAQNDSLTPQPLVLTFFELTNKLTGKHKIILNKAVWFLKKNKDYHLLATGGSDNSKQRFITNVRIRNIFNFLGTKHINDSVLHTFIAYELDNHIVKLIFYKNVVINNPLTNFDSVPILALNFNSLGCWLNKQNKLELQQLAKYVVANNCSIKISAGTISSSVSIITADCRLKSITKYLTTILQINANQILSEQSEDINDETVEINILPPK